MKELWYVSCSPRNPAKIKKELACLAQLEGEKWNAKDKAKRNITQLKFAKMLRELPEFEGQAAGKESDFSARDRVAPMKTYGFAYVDEDDRIKITEAGKALIDSENEEHIFLMQMLKWQYPSAQHHGPAYTDRPPTLFTKKILGFSILPYVFTLKVAKETEGLTKQEIAMVLLPQRRMLGISKVVKEIEKYRAKRNKIKGRVNKRKYDLRHHSKVFRRIYKETLATIAAKVNRDKELKKKISNSLDVADACMRLFRYTGLFTTIGDRLVLNPTRMDEIEVIFDSTWKPRSFYLDTEKFYHYFGDPEMPALPFTKKSFLIKKAIAWLKQIEKMPLSGLLPDRLRTLTPGILKTLSTKDLSSILNNLRDWYRELKGKSLEDFLRSDKGQKEVLDFYESIVSRDVADPAAFFEWNTWRSLIALDDANKIISFMKMDDMLQPVDCARGNRPDMKAEFKDYVVAVEVSLSSGRRQYITETEPVTFHVAKCQTEESKGRRRKVYGLFIAPKLHRHTADYFYNYIKHLKVPDHGNVTVVPFSLEKWMNLLETANSLGYLRNHALGNLLHDIESKALASPNSDTWLNTIDLSISEWKKSLTIEH